MSVKLRHMIVCLTLLAALPLRADIVMLNNGLSVRGKLVLQNDEVVIIQNAEGRRFQYPMSEVLSISSEETIVEEDEKKESTSVVSDKHITILVELAGGGAFLPHSAAGGHVGAELMLGSRYIGKRPVFLGGGIGIHSLMMGETYTFLPLELAIKAPLLTGIHSPFVGMQIGYGFALSKSCTGGIFAGIQVGYRYQLNRATALLLSLNMQFQQTTLATYEVITSGTESTVYMDNAGRSFVVFGARVGFTF